MDDARPKMCFSPSPPPSIPKAIFSSNLTFGYKCSSDNFCLQNTTYSYHCQDYNNNNIVGNKEKDNMQRPEDIANTNVSKTEDETTSDYKQWLHAMKLVARLPGGIPPEFRRKLWLSLADKYLKSKNVDWAKEEEKCFCEKWREDDEELGIQIVKDLHRTGSTFCTGPAGDLNQAKLKRILLGYARYNPEVGYCQGFNMLGALILQVMDKNESESMKVMIYLVEGILPTGYFCGSMGGLQADMAVFRELMQTKLPRLAKHLQKLQGPIENAYEPPLTNVFTMQWFLTMFCTCLPMSCVLRVWDLVLIEGSDVLLRTALALWSLLEERVLSARSADDFYGKMGSFSNELLNGHLIDSNGLIEKVVKLGPIADIQKLRDKHLYNAAAIERQQGLQLYFDDDEPDIDEDSRLAVATVWGIPWGRRGSHGQTNNNIAKSANENKDRIALDISLLKKQYDRLRERQKQAQIILTTACTTASRQSATTTPLPVNQLLSGRPAIVTNKGRRTGPPTGAIPPARKPSLPAVLHDKPLEKQLRRGETLYWRDTKDTGSRRDSLSWKEIKAERAAMITSGSIDGLKSQKIRSGRLGKSDSSSYSEESDENEAEVAEDVSSTDTSLCDEDLQQMPKDEKQHLHIENNHKSSSKILYKSNKKTNLKKQKQSVKVKNNAQKTRPKSWAPSNTEIPFVLMTADSPIHSADENPELVVLETVDNDALNEEKDSSTNLKKEKDQTISPIPDELAILEMEGTPFNTFESRNKEEEEITILGTTMSLGVRNGEDVNTRTFDISKEGVTNEYFERVNSTERPTKLDLFYSLNEDENVEDNEFDRSNEKSRPYGTDKSNNIRCMDLLVDYSEKSSAACIEEAKTEISTTFQTVDTTAPASLKIEYPIFQNESLLRKTRSSAEKRRDPRRLTLTRSSTMDIEKRYEAFEKRFSMDICSNYTRFSDETEFNVDSCSIPHQSVIASNKKTNNTNSDPMNHVTNHKTLSTEKCFLVDKKIPSTADLEQRFENIQQQLVRDRDRNRMIQSPCDSENTERQPNLNSSSETNIEKNSEKDKTTKQPIKHDDNEENNKIEGGQAVNAHSDIEEKSSASSEFKDLNNDSSTKDTESNVDHASQSTASERKTSLASKKEPPDESRDEDVVEKDGLSRNYAFEMETNTNSKESEEPQRDQQKACSEMVEETRNGSERTSDRTSPPSTEELEKRFSALEEQMNSAKIESNETQFKQQNKSDAIADKESLSKSDIETGKKEADISNDDTSADLKTSLTKFEMSEEKTKRRLSEPPSTEDLERRYEVLKRRMSSRNFETRSLHKVTLPPEAKHVTNNYSTKTSKNSPSKQSPPSIENLEERFEKLQNKNEPKSAIVTESPPSIENLEERFEKLQNKNETVSSGTSKSPSSKQSPDERSESLQGKSHSTQAKDQAPNKNKNGGEDPYRNSEMENKASNDDETQTSSKIETAPPAQTSKLIIPLVKNANKIKIKLIEELQAKIKEHSINTDIESSIQKKTAIIEELKTKIDSSQDKTLKPTQISLRRKSPTQSAALLPGLSFNDETLESHATSAYHRSEKHEPAKRKMVRRFSDLPSRADLENRLKFLEEQLNKTVCMQRRSSDSEVSSKARLKHKTPLANVPTSDSLEYRVQEVEKHLKDNRTFSMDVECSNSNEKNDPDIEISQVELATDTAAVTGKELVRYSSHGEVGDIEHQNPINISINIQMTLNKEDIGTKKSTQVCKTDDLDRRLQFLERQLKTSQLHDTSKTVADNDEESVRGEDAINITDGNNDRIEKDASTHVEDINTTKIADDIRNENNEFADPSETGHPTIVTEIWTEESKQSENDLIPDEDSDKPDNSDQVIQTHEEIENTPSNESHEDTNSQRQPALIKEDKEIENKAIEIRTKENKALDQTKSKDNSTSNKDETHTSSIQRDTQIQANEVSNAQELVHLDEHSKSQPNKTIKRETCEPDETENLQKDDYGSETKATAEVENFIGLNNCSQFVPVEVNKKTLVLLLDNEPKAVKVRRLTRANTQELEDLFQALEKQLSDRGQQKVCERLSKTASDEISQNDIEACKAMSDLAKEIEAFSKTDSKTTAQNDNVTQESLPPKKQEEEFDWGSDPIKYHLKKRTVYLPSTKELEARFRSLERQIKILEDVEKIDVEQRLLEIERKIKLQYSLSHEKDLNKFLELCEGKDPDVTPTLENNQQDRGERCVVDSPHDHKCNIRQTSPGRLKESSQPRNPEYCYRSLDLKNSKSKQSHKKQPIHPLEMLLDPSPDESDIPTTGELEHRIRVMEEKRCTPPSPSSRKSRSQSPIHQTRNTHILEKMTASPTERELPTAEELEARLEALEKEQCFNFKMQKDFQQFNQKLKDVVSPSLSFDEFKSPTKTCDSAQKKTQPSTASKQPKTVNTTSPKTIRFYDQDQSLPQQKIESSKPFPESRDVQKTQVVREGLGVMGIRLMRETSPLRRKGTHTGVPLRTGENINDQLTSIQNTIKSIDTLCEEKPYRKERCQQYIDSLFSDSTYFAHKKASLEDLPSHNLSRSTSREIGPSIRISDHSPAFSRSMGSADSIQSSSPLRSSSPLHYRSNRDLRREPSPRRRREEDREEHESRVRRDNLLPNNINYSHSILSHTSHSSLTKFHKVDSQLIPNDVTNEYENEESLRHPTTFSTIDNTIYSYHDNTNTSNGVNTTSQRTLNNAEVTSVALSDLSKSRNSDRLILPVYQTVAPNTPVYTPAKLEIRHTTVTSTFYDRVLTEKQLEKQHHLSFPTNNQSPLISPQSERHVKAIYQQETARSPTKLSHNDTITASTGNYHRSSYQTLTQTNDHS